MIFNWISRCWGGMGVTTRFEKARLNCCIADWTVPYEDDILSNIDQNPEIPAKTALNTFLSHLQTDDQRVHPAFLLKHLYVLDHCVEQMTAIDTIGYYYNSNLSASHIHSNFDVNGLHSPLRQLISSYYSYLITKARNYSHYENSYFSQNMKVDSMKECVTSSQLYLTKTVDNRLFQSDLLNSGKNLDFMNSSGKKKKARQCTKEQNSIYKMFCEQQSYNSVFEVIEKCQQIQKCIINMNRCYQQGPRKVDLIKFIFVMCLRTYIRCYIIVSVGLRYLLKDFMSMKIKELEKLVKMFQYFNNQYTRDFINFVENNKNDIEAFKDINYQEFTYLEKDQMRLLIEYKEEFKQKLELQTSSIFPYNQSDQNYSVNASLIPKEESFKNMILELPTEVHIKVKQNMKIFYKPRKNMQFCLMEKSKRKINDFPIYIDQFEEETLISDFQAYPNCYHQTFSPSFDDAVDVNLILSKKFQSSNEMMSKTPNLLEKFNSEDLTKESSQQQKVYSSCFEKSNIEKEEQKSKIIKSGILGSNLQNSRKPLKNWTNAEVKEMFQPKKKEYKECDAWQEWSNVYSENSLVARK